MGTLSKDMITQWIIPYLPVGKRGFKPTVSMPDLVNCIFYRLKTGCQWRELPLKTFFGDTSISWNTVYYHFNRWSKAGCWQKVWVSLLAQNKHYLDLSSIALDGSQTLAKNGGDAIGYQGRKAGRTTNALFVCDKQGVFLAMSVPQAGQHHDLFEIQTLFGQICTLLKEAGICLKGLFLNADAGFDAEAFKNACQKEEINPNVYPNPRNKDPQKAEPCQTGTPIFDEELYKHRAVIERANAWLDGFKALLIRFEHSIRNWMTMHFLAFIALFLRKLSKKQAKV